MQQSDLVNWLERKNGEWEALLARVGPARMDQPGVNGDWSMTDLVAHLTGWNRFMAARLQAAVRGEPEPLPPWPAALQGQGDDAINTWIEAAYRGRSAAEVLDESRRVYQQIGDAVAHLPADARFEVVAPDYQLVWVGNTRYQPGEFFDHFQHDHEPNVRAWLAREGDAAG
jgi:hypothetical protein